MTEAEVQAERNRLEVGEEVLIASAYHIERLDVVSPIRKMSMNSILLVGGVGKQVVKTKVANEVNWANGPNQSMEAGETLIDAHVSNKF
jgi:hypothetical protein